MGPRELLGRLAAWRKRDALDRELAADLRAHVDLLARDLEDDGIAPADAIAAARRQVGNVTHLREQSREFWGFPAVDAALHDLRYALRGLRRSPGFTLTVAVVLALGLGANAALFSLLDRIFLRVPAGVIAPQEIRRLYYVQPQLEIRVFGPADAAHEPATYPQYTAMRDAVRGDVQFATYVRPDSVETRIANATVPAMMSYVTRSYFPMLGVRPALGRFFTADEDRIDVASPVAVISAALWHRAFAGDSAVLGKHVSIAGRTFTVIGVASHDFSGIDLDRVDLWLPLGAFLQPPYFTQPWYMGGFGVLRVIARMPQSVTEHKLTTVASVAYRRAQQEYGNHDSASTVITGPIVSALGPSNRAQEVSISLRLAGVSLMLLLIAIGNVANLQLIRGMRRRREIAIRRALGVSRARLYRQLMTESLLLSTLGAAAAVIIGVWGSVALRALLLPEIHWSDDFHATRIIAFTAIASVITGTLAGLVPAFRATGLDLNEALKAGAKSGVRGRTWSWRMLTVGQAALSVVLLVGAGLFVRSLRNVRAIDLGFDPQRLVSINVRGDDSASREQMGPAIAEVAAELAGLANVELVAIGTQAPMQGSSGERLFFPGRDSVPKVDNMPPLSNHVSPEFFNTMGIHLAAGRTFTPDDRAGAAPVAIINRTMARVAWPAENPLGKCILMDMRTAPCTTVVGVVDDTHDNDIVEPTHFMQFYLPLAQTVELDHSVARRGRFLIARTRPGAEAAVLQFAVRATRERLPRITVQRVNAMTRVLEPKLRPWRLGATLFSILGALAAIVALVGMYSVIAYSAGQRAHEMSIRAALGARAQDIVFLVAGDGLRIVVVSVAIGIACAAVMGRLITSLVYGVSTHDPLVFVGACVLLTLMGLTASLVPAMRAARSDPASALRAE
jgi:putative ABC transport system permease protein